MCIYCTLDWETKEQYIDLLEKLISKEINSFKFYIKFKERNDLNGEVVDSLSSIYEGCNNLNGCFYF